MVPEPASMTPETANFVLSYMGLFLGIDASGSLHHPMERSQFQTRYTQLKSGGLIPPQPALGRDSWQKLRNYYLALAKKPSREPERGVAPEKIQVPYEFDDQAITLLRRFESDTLAIGGGVKNLLRMFRISGELKWEKKFTSPPVWIENDGDKWYVLTLGDLLGSVNPKQLSELWEIGPRGERRLLTGLPRSSHFEFVKKGGVRKFFISSFGGLGNGKFSCFTFEGDVPREKILSRRDSHVRSRIISGDGPLRVLSLAAGAREQLILYTETNEGFSEKILAEYPPHTGSVWIDLADVDGDGREEILVLSGDNADSGPWNEIKEDQGLRIYGLSENAAVLKKFIPIPGALSFHILPTIAGKFHIAIARFYAPNESLSDIVVLKHKKDFVFERKDFRIDSRATVLSSVSRNGVRNLIVGAGNTPKFEIVGGSVTRRDFSGDLLTEFALH
ncbi:MAG: VCBS repeat-containing protein [Leptospiraceae bacterium]|nr:VCBS repeat-containing protein [Leptospiraceae bacterium]